ncbi:MAG: hypothetical protein E6J74_27835 [Deltaproteobacteria bacterium]|nr:MAG: hypothetical protein E6J74_27835 [Deltaproteobacteria bacterium]
MSKNESFTLGLKWIGVYCLALAVGELFEFFPITFNYAPQLLRAVPGFKVSEWMSLMGPVGFSVIGAYLIRDGSYIQTIAFRHDNRFDVSGPRAFLDLGLKLYGVYVIAGSLPSFLWIAANVLIVLRAAPYLSVENELEGIRSYLLPVLSTIGLGICCFAYSRKLSGVAFRVPERSAR